MVQSAHPGQRAALFCLDHAAMTWLPCCWCLPAQHLTTCNEHFLSVDVVTGDTSDSCVS